MFTRLAKYLETVEVETALATVCKIGLAVGAALILLAIVL